MARIYCRRGATGANNGQSLADAYTSLSAALAALSAAPAGSVLEVVRRADRPEGYAESPQDADFHGSFGGSGVPISGQTILFRGGATLTQGRFSTEWVDEGDGIFSLALASAPGHVAFDFRPDDAAGTVTGVDLTGGTHAKALALARSRWLGWADADLRAHYGLLVNEVATTEPEEGNWSHTDGTLYVHPPAGATLADVIALCCYCVAGDALNLYGQGWTVDGVCGLLYPVTASNGGYVVNGENAANATIRNGRGVSVGWHGFGMVNNSTAGNLIEDCLVVGHARASGDLANPYVFYANSHQPEAGHVGRRLAFVAHPLLNTGGSPLNAAFKPRLGYAHTDGGSNTLGGVVWSDVLQLDYSDETGATGQGDVIGAANQPADFDTVIERPIASGRAAVPGPAVEHRDVWLNRDGAGSLSADPIVLSTGSAAWKYRVRGGLITAGKFSAGWATVASAGDSVDLEDVVFRANDNPSTAKRVLFPSVSDTAVGFLKLRNCDFDSSVANVDGLVGHSSFYTNGTPVSVDSDGSNIFGPGLASHMVRHVNTGGVPNGRDAAWWASNVAADTFVEAAAAAPAGVEAEASGALWAVSWDAPTGSGHTLELAIAAGAPAAASASAPAEDQEAELGPASGRLWARTVYEAQEIAGPWLGFGVLNFTAAPGGVVPEIAMFESATVTADGGLRLSWMTPSTAMRHPLDADGAKAPTVDGIAWEWISPPQVDINEPRRVSVTLMPTTPFRVGATPAVEVAEGYVTDAIGSTTAVVSATAASGSLVPPRDSGSLAGDGGAADSAANSVTVLANRDAKAAQDAGDLADPAGSTDDAVLVLARGRMSTIELILAGTGAGDTISQECVVRVFGVDADAYTKDGFVNLRGVQQLGEDVTLTAKDFLTVGDLKHSPGYPATPIDLEGYPFILVMVVTPLAGNLSDAVILARGTP